MLLLQGLNFFLEKLFWFKYFHRHFSSTFIKWHIFPNVLSSNLSLAHKKRKCFVFVLRHSVDPFFLKGFGDIFWYHSMQALTHLFQNFLILFLFCSFEVFGETNKKLSYSRAKDCTLTIFPHHAPKIGRNKYIIKIVYVDYVSISVVVNTWLWSKIESCRIS